MATNVEKKLPLQNLSENTIAVQISTPSVGFASSC